MTPSARQGRRTSIAFWIGGAAVLIVIAVIAGGPGEEGAALDPQSTGPLGTRALVLLLGELGAHVEVADGRPPASADTALLLDDHLDAADATATRAWVATGGTLLVADPFSELAPSVAGPAGIDIGLGAASVARGSCDIGALRALDRVDPAGGVLFAVPAGADRCFGSEGEAFVVAEAAGDGVVVSVGSPYTFTNEALGSFDDSVLAANVLVPAEGVEVAVIEPRTIGSGDTSLVDLMSRQVKQAIVQLAVAFVLYALWRARRLGKPVAEPQPVQLAGSELVVAVGGLLQQTRSPDRAAAILRRDLRRTLAARFGLPPTASPDVIADAVSGRTGVDHARIAAAVEDAPVASEADLVALAQLVESIRQEALHGQPA